MTINVFDIKRYAINDGPGIRTTIFFKGCPLRCVWCHNPESWEVAPEILFKSARCIGCNSCGWYPDQLPPKKEDVAEALGRQLTPCDCCPTMALERCGKEWEIEDLLKEIEKERDVMTDSGGGVTLCGGEPLMQSEGALMLLMELGHRRFHRTVDTSLFASWETVRKIAMETELFLVDIKHMGSAEHRRLTGVGNEQILENIRLLSTLLDDQEGKSEKNCYKRDIWFRMPLIEGINADEKNIGQTALFIASLKRSDEHPWRIHLLPYHDIGKDKHRRRGSVYNPDHLPMAVPSEDTITRCQQQFEHHGIQVVIGG